MDHLHLTRSLIHLLLLHLLLLHLLLIHVSSLHLLMLHLVCLVWIVSSVLNHRSATSAEQDLDHNPKTDDATAAAATATAADQENGPRIASTASCDFQTDSDI